jgi:hypothetical protein
MKLRRAARRYVRLTVVSGAESMRESPKLVRVSP